MRASVFKAVCAAALAFSGCRHDGDLLPPPKAPGQLDRSTSYSAALSEGDAAYAERTRPVRLEGAVAAYGRALALRPDSVEAEMRLARAEAFIGESAEPARSKKAWEASSRAAERALRRIAPAWAAAIDDGEDPASAASRVEASGAEPLYWLALGSMRVAQATGYAAVLAVKDFTLAMMARAALLDERIDAAGPHRALGAWLAALPVAAGGGAGPSLAHFDRCRALAPEDLLFRVDEAQTYAVLTQDPRLFDRLLDEVAGFDLARDPGRKPENEVAKRRAETLKAQKTRLF